MTNLLAMNHQKSMVLPQSNNHHQHHHLQHQQNHQPSVDHLASNLVKSATLGTLASGHRQSMRQSTAGLKILSDIPKAEFNLTSSTTFFNKSESCLHESNSKPPPSQSQPQSQQQQQQPSQQQQRPLPAVPRQKSSAFGMQRNSAAMILQSELIQQSNDYQQTYTNSNRQSTGGAMTTFELTPILPESPPLSNSSEEATNRHQSSSHNIKPTSPNSSSTTSSVENHREGTTITASSSASRQQISSTTNSTLPPVNHQYQHYQYLQQRQYQKITKEGSTSSSSSSNSSSKNPGELQKQQEQVFRRFGCQRLLEMQKRIEENCRLSERQQNEQEAVTRLLTNIRRNIKTTDI